MFFFDWIIIESNDSGENKSSDNTEDSEHTLATLVGKALGVEWIHIFYLHCVVLYSSVSTKQTKAKCKCCVKCDIIYTDHTPFIVLNRSFQERLR